MFTLIGNFFNSINPFKEKLVYTTLSAKGHKHWFKVISADGKEYHVTRTDFIDVWDGYKSWYARFRTFDAAKMLEYGKDSVAIDDSRSVIPIYVSEYKREPKFLVKTWSQTYRFDAPILDVGEGIERT